jgi:hypothetical protein
VRRHQVTKEFGFPDQPFFLRKGAAIAVRPPCISTTVPYWSNMQTLDFLLDVFVAHGVFPSSAFLYQIFVRRFGTNNFPDCSNMCHEPTSVGLPMSIGIGKGTVLLEDFDRTDSIFVIGQNPGTNSPWMMTSLRNASRRGVPIVAINPLRERALERLAAPQAPVEMVTLSSTPISSECCQVKVGGDVLKGMMKNLLAAHEVSVRNGGKALCGLRAPRRDSTLSEQAWLRDVEAAQ